MKKRGIGWMYQPRTCDILISLSYPNTPRIIEKKYGIKKLKLSPYISNGILRCLNPCSRKGRLYVLSEKARKSLSLSNFETDDQMDWDLFGWIIASPKQRFIVLKTVAMDFAKRTSENIRQRASTLNPCLTRISTKTILKELIEKTLVMSEMVDRKRYHWISGKGKDLWGNIEKLWRPYNLNTDI